MSIRVPLSSLSSESKKNIEANLIVKGWQTKKWKQNRFQSNDEMEFFMVKDSKACIPFSHARQFPSLFPFTEIEYPKSSNYKFNLQLNPIQEEIKNETYEILNRNRCILIQLYTGCGKSYYAIYLASKLKYITMILCHRLSIIDQWAESIKNACPDASIQIVEGSDKLKEGIDFYIMNVTNVPKKFESDLKKIGLLIVDEAHAQATDNFLQNILMFQPKYLVGLTATPEQVKNYSLNLLYGSEWIIRMMNRPFNVYVVNTKFKPKVETTDNGDVNWNSVLESQAKSVEFNQIVLKIIKYFSFRKPFILCKRKEQTMYLYNNLIKEKNKREVEIYIGTQRKYNKDAKIFLSSYSKSGTGFDAPEYDTFILGSDVAEGFIQYLGRVFRKPYTTPIVIDICCDNPIMKRHLLERRKIYQNSGGIVKDISSFPELFEDLREVVSATKFKQLK